MYFHILYFIVYHIDIKWIEKTNRLQKNENPPVFPLPHTVFIDSVVIHFF